MIEMYFNSVDEVKYFLIFYIVFIWLLDKRIEYVKVWKVVFWCFVRKKMILFKFL